MKSITLPFLVIFCAVLPSLVLAQDRFINLGQDDYRLLERIEIKTGRVPEKLNTFLKPYSIQEAAAYLYLSDSFQLKHDKLDRKLIEKKQMDYWQYFPTVNNESEYPVLRSIYKRKTDFYTYQTENLLLRFNPIAHFELMKEFNSTETKKYINTRAIEFSGSIDGKVGFYTYLGENQWRPMDFMENKIIRDQAVPGNGFYKEFKSTKAVDYLDARGYITLKATKYIQVQFGQDKNFWGYGIRSLFLSDQSASYPFLKLQTRFGRFDYENLYTELTMQYVRGSDKLLPKKYATLHHLSYNLFKNCNVGVFEAVVFSRNRQYELAYLNPIIFYRQVEQALGSPDNAMLGGDLKFDFAKHFQLYGQVLMDEFKFSHFRKMDGWWANKFGFLGGLKYIDVFGIKNLDLLVEADYIRPYTYSHKDSLANFTHYNQPLAHPMGANLMEMISHIMYQPASRFTLNWYTAIQSYGTDTSGSNWGGNVFLDYNTYERSLGNVVGQGVHNKALIMDFTATWEARHNVFIDLNLVKRVVHSDDAAREYNGLCLGMGLRMNVGRKQWLY